MASLGYNLTINSGSKVRRGIEPLVLEIWGACRDDEEFQKTLL